jgi:lipopolysaccharide/colanic/teichoic acid biosynthesis glycosyltransferase
LSQGLTAKILLAPIGKVLKLDYYIKKYDIVNKIISMIKFRSMLVNVDQIGVDSTTVNDSFLIK